MAANSKIILTGNKLIVSELYIECHQSYRMSPNKSDAMAMYLHITLDKITIMLLTFQIAGFTTKQTCYIPYVHTFEVHIARGKRIKEII